ncbi:MAG: hypothetical protein ACRESZ_04105 [Methylococcales bacterium]
MSFYLRVEAVNLGNFVRDTNNLATIRGGSLLLLAAIDEVERLIEPNISQKNIGELLKENLNRLDAEKKVLKGLRGEAKKIKQRELKQLRDTRKDLKKSAEPSDHNSPNTPSTITKGASWGLFELDIDYATATKIKQGITDFFNNDPTYKHATFVVDIYPVEEPGNYQVARDKAQTLNRYQQLQAPSLAITREGGAVCAINKITPAPANPNLYLPSEPGETKHVCASETVVKRREYGTEQQRQGRFYSKITGRSDNDRLNLTQDLAELSQYTYDGGSILDGKIAFIYIDGNQFGARQKACQTPMEQRGFDTQTRAGRMAVLKSILEEIEGKANWLNGDKLRLETLLWGGDEIIWVVPAWQGWWMLARFYHLAKIHIQLRTKDGPFEKLFHGSSIVFCKHNAPIHRIDALARKLADNFAKKSPYKNENRIAYEVLESFDHAGTDLDGFRRKRIRGLTDNINDLLIKAEDMDAIETAINTLKGSGFPKRKIYQLVQKYRARNESDAQRLHKKLSGEVKGIPATEQQKIWKAAMDALKYKFNNSNAYWIHLMELWDYVGLKNVETNQPNGEDS